MAATVRELQPADVPRLLDLIDGLADYERLPRPTAQARARLARDAAAEPPRFQTLLAELEGQVVGYAIYFFTYSTFLARPSLYLEDIFVLPDHRGRGAGRALFRACAAEAVRQECGRMEWSVLAWNQPSIDFYLRSGAEMLDGWRGCRLSGDALTAAARPTADR